MNEIEIKLQIDRKEEIIDKLKSLGCGLSDEVKQVDTIFLDNKTSDFKIETGMIVLRIRQLKDKNILTLKQRKKELMESKEIEFSISDYAAGKDFLETLGYKEMVTVSKKRIKTKFKDFNICIDEVENLGAFVEIEIVTDKDDMAEYYEKEMYKVCEELGLDTNKRIYSHYDTMLYEKMNQ